MKLIKLTSCNKENSPVYIEISMIKALYKHEVYMGIEPAIYHKKVESKSIFTTKEIYVLVEKEKVLVKDGSLVDLGDTRYYVRETNEEILKMLEYETGLIQKVEVE